MSIKHSPADVTLVCMRARGVYSIHRGGDILATHQGKGVYFINRRGDVILTTHLSKMILSGLGASQDSAPVGRRKQGPPSVVFQSYLSSSLSLSLLLCHYHHYHHYHYYYVIIIIIIIIIICSLSLSALSAHAACPPTGLRHWLSLLVSLGCPPDVQTSAETKHWGTFIYHVILERSA